MSLRSSRDPHSKAAIPGRPQLTLASWIVTLENITSFFARPLLLAGFFVAAAWLGLFTALYPWAHLVALVLFTVLFFDALGRARRHFRPVGLASAKRRVEEASGLAHRPFDALDDRPIIAGEDQQILWRAHVEHSRENLKTLRWPRWMLNFSARDPYALRYAVAILLAIGLFASWGVWGGRILAAVNPALGSGVAFFHPALDAWITPPEYTGLPPIMIATPAGARHEGEVLDVPEGSVITAHLAEKSGDAPILAVNGTKQEFGADEHADFGVTTAIEKGDEITIRRGWQKLGSWHIRVVPDQAPQIALTEPPAVTGQRSVKLSYDATDDYGVTSIIARVTPRETLPGADNGPADIELATPNAKDVKRSSFEDLTASPFAGLAVRVALLARDAAGHEAESAPADFTLPERTFFHPLARALIEERKKLLQYPDDDSVRNEAANLMAGIAAHQIAAYRGDPVVAMALRGGAVRLVLNHGREIVPSVTDILWQTAVRIEDGATVSAEAGLRQARKDLADALDRNAGEEEIEARIDRLRAALANYLAQLSSGASAQNAGSGLEEALGSQGNVLTPGDLDRMLQRMRDLSLSGARDEARAALSQLDEALENISSGPPQLTAAQKETLGKLAALRELGKKQQELMDETFREAQSGTAAHMKALQSRQEELQRALQGIMGKNVSENLTRGEGAMKEAASYLKSGSATGAVPQQNEALKALRQGMEDMAGDLRASMFMLPRPGGMENPFGEGGFGGFAQGSVKVPDRMEVRRVREILDELQRRAGDGARSKTERDYIDRLLQNF